MKKKKNFYYRIVKRLEEIGYEPIKRNSILTTDKCLQRRADVKNFLLAISKNDERARRVRIVVFNLLIKIENAHKDAEKSKLHF